MVTSYLSAYLMGLLAYTTYGTVSRLVAGRVCYQCTKCAKCCNRSTTSPRGGLADARTLMLPLSLLRTAAGHPMVRTRPAHSPARPRRARPAYSPARVRPAPSQLVELKNGETYNGELVSCDSWMNIR